MSPATPTKPKPTNTSKTRHNKYKVKTSAKALHTARAPSDDLAIENIKLNDQELSLSLTALISDLKLEQAMDGASTLTLVVFDPTREVLQSPLAATASTIIFDRVSYTLVGVEIQDADLTLLFEETAVHVLRGEKGPVKANRYNTTRAQFIRSLARQPQGYNIPFQAPEVNIKQPIAGGKIDVLAEASWLTPAGGVKRTKTGSQQATADTGGKGQGWITVGATWFSGSQGSCGSLAGGMFYAELGSAGNNAGMGPLLAPLFGNHGGYRGGLACGYAIEVEFHGKVVRATKQDIGSGQGGDAHYKIDLHQGLADALGFTSAGRADVRVRKA